MYEDKTAIVIDNGSYECKAGMAGDDEPRCCFRTIVGRPKKNFKIKDKGIYVGDEVLSRINALQLNYPIQCGIIQDWEDMEIIWNHLYLNELRVKPEEHPVLLTESPMNPTANRQKMAEIFFEKFKVPSFCTINQAVLSLSFQGRSTGIVLDSGDGVSNIVPIDGCWTNRDAVLRIDLAGRACTHNLISICDEFDNSTQSDIEIVRDIKEKLCYVALDFEEEMKKYKESAANNRHYELPDGNILVVQNQRFRCTELLFNPQLFNIHYLGIKVPGIHELLKSSIEKCDIDLREEYYGNILLSGGNTMLPGFQERLSKELTLLSRSNQKKKIIAPPQRKYAAFIGGSDLSFSSSFQMFLISGSEYQESGPSILHKSIM